MKKVFAIIISLFFFVTLSFAVVGCKKAGEQNPEEAAKTEAPAPVPAAPEAPAPAPAPAAPRYSASAPTAPRYSAPLPPPVAEVPAEAPSQPLDLKGSDKIVAFWNTWFEKEDENTRVKVLQKDATYCFVLDISKYTYFRDFSAKVDSSLAKAIEENRKQNKTTIRFRIRPILQGDCLSFTDNQRAWEELKVNINKLIQTDKDYKKNLDKLSSGEIKLHDFANKVQAGEVKFDLLAKRSGDATILITIWDENGMIPLDHLSVSVRVIDENTPAGTWRPVSDTIPLRAGRQTLLNVSSDFSSSGPLLADAAFYVFEETHQGKSRSMVLFAAKTGDTATGVPDDISVYAWETESLLSNYIEDPHNLIAQITEARLRTTSIDENTRKYSYQLAADELRKKIFGGLTKKDQKQAADAEKIFRQLVKRKDQVVFARMRNENGNSVYLPLGILAASSSSRFLDKRIILVQPLPRERYPAGKHSVQTWTFNIPDELTGLKDPTKTALSQLQKNLPYRRDISTVKTYFEAIEPAASSDSPEGVILLAHQAGGNFWFTNMTDRIVTEDIKRQFPAGSVAILSACSMASAGGNNQNILEKLNNNGIDAMIISPFPVDAEYGAMLAIHFVKVIENAKNHSQSLSVAELFSMASEQTANYFKEKQGKNCEDMDLEFLIAGDYRIKIAPK